MVEKTSKDINKEVNMLRRELNVVKRNFRNKFNLIINELQKLGYNGYEIILEPQIVQDPYLGLIEKVNPKKTFKDVVLNEEI